MPVFTFYNYQPIYFDFSDNNEHVNFVAKPYPSLISVFDLPSQIHNISIHLYGLQAEFLNNLTILLVSPDLRSNLILLNAIGNNLKPQRFVDISIIDQAPVMSKNTSLLNNSSYHPTSYANLSFLPPLSPFPPYFHSLPYGNYSIKSAFIDTNINLNGNWALYVFSSGTPISFSINGGWSISFYTPFNDNSIE